MSKRPAPGAPPDRVDAYDRLVASVPGVERTGASLPYTSANGNDASGDHQAAVPDSAPGAPRIELRYGHPCSPRSP